MHAVTLQVSQTRKCSIFMLHDRLSTLEIVCVKL